MKDSTDFRCVKMCGAEYDWVLSEITDLMEIDNPKVECRLENGEVHVTVSALDTQEKSAAKLVKATVKELKTRFGGYIYTTESDETLEESIIELMAKNSLTLSTVESCTGGMVASRLINVPGASEVYKEGFITYSNKSKRHRVGVKKSTLKKYGAVSEQTAKEMSKGGCKFTEADACIATTGIAGPGGGTEEKPVGLVYISCTVCGETEVKEFHFTGERADVREAACAEALSLLRICILKYYSKKTF